MNKLGITLKKLREKKDMTIRELSEKADVGYGTIGDIERGKNSTTIPMLEKLSIGLGLSQQEREELFASFMPDDIAVKITDERVQALNTREKKQYNHFMEDATLYFTDNKISEEDKKKVLDTLTELFFEAKHLNKRKK